MKYRLQSMLSALAPTLSLMVIALIIIVSPVKADYRQHPSAVAVINTLVDKHGFSVAQVNAVLKQAETEQRILDSMTNAAEKTKTWTAYRSSFLSPFRITKGAEFLVAHKSTFDQVEQEYGVPREIITAILGVETNYGGYTGKTRVLNALSTLAFEHPRRSRFFTSELIQYIVLCREQQWDASEQLGSYAGAMGMSQFMPSNYRRLAIDGDGDGDIDLFEPVDAIHSIANYFIHHGWQNAQPVTSRVAVRQDFDVALIGRGLKPNHSVARLAQGGFYPQDKTSPSVKARVIRFNDADGDEFWFGYQNFYAISRYNPRSKYAMAVYQLSLAIEKQAKDNPQVSS